MRLGLNILKVFLACALLVTTACADIERTTGLSKDTQTGAAVGAAAGGIISAIAGASTGWIIAATVLGAVAGGLVADYMTDRDKEMAGATTHDTLENAPTGQTSTWNNPDSGNSGSVTVTDTYQKADGTNCRNFSQTVNAGGETETGTGTACRNTDGTWQVQG